MPVTLSSPTILEVLRQLTSAFNQACLAFGHGFINAEDEAWALVSHVLAMEYPNLAQRDFFLSARLTEAEIAAVNQLANQRITQRLPMAYLTGEAWLGGYSFRAVKGVIVPRSLLAQPLLERLSPWLEESFTPKRILELCCGSASLMIVAAIVFPEATVDGVDINPLAINAANANIADYGLENRVQVFLGDLFQALPAKNQYDLIIANPPYVDRDTMHKLPAEYLAEPALALAGGEDGLDLVHRILREAKHWLSPQGFVLLEMGDHAEALFHHYPAIAPVLLNNDSGEACIALLSAEDINRIDEGSSKKRG